MPFFIMHAESGGIAQKEVISFIKTAKAAQIVLKSFDYEISSGIELIQCLVWQSLEQ